MVEVDELWELARREESVDVNARLVEEDISFSFLALGLVWWGKRDALEAILERVSWSCWCCWCQLRGSALAGVSFQWSLRLALQPCGGAWEVGAF